MARDDADKVGEFLGLLAVRMRQLITDFKAVAAKRLQADALHLFEEVLAGDIVAGLADAAAERKGEGLAVFGQALDEYVVGKVYGKWKYG